MALQFNGENKVPTYMALSTDIVDSAIDGASLVGATVFTSDNKQWYVIEKDLTLSEYALPVVLEGGITTDGLTDTELRATPVPMSLYDAQTLRGMRISPGNSALVADQTTRIIGTMFGQAIDTNFWTVANNGTSSGAAIGATTQAGIVLLTSGTTDNGYGSLVSVRHARFLFVNPNLFRMAARLTATTATNCTRIIGAMGITAGNPPTRNNGYYFAYDGTGALTVNCKVAGQAASTVSSGSFNGQVASYSVDTNVHAYEILYYVMGVWFFIDGVLIHKFTPTTGILNNELDVHCFAESVNSTGASSGVLEVWASSVLRLGKEVTRPTYKNLSANATTVLKTGGGSLQSIVINAFGAGNTITIYDNTSAVAPVIATFVASADGVYTYNLDFQTGLTIVLSGGVASNVTIVYD